MKSNRRTGAESNTGPTVRKSVNLKEASGVYDQNPDVGLSQYKHSMGKDTIPIKFAETIGMPTQRNSITSAENHPSRIAQKSTKSTIKKGPNRYESAVKKKAGF